MNHLGTGILRGRLLTIGWYPKARPIGKRDGHTYSQHEQSYEPSTQKVLKPKTDVTQGDLGGPVPGSVLAVRELRLMY